MHKHLRRLDRVWVQDPVYFVTSCAYKRAINLACNRVRSVLVDEWQKARTRHGWAIGRYVIMPGHVHFFCAPEPGGESISQFIGSWKQWTSKRIRVGSTLTTPLWQEEFFDRVLRSVESFSQKWEYVRADPVRAGLASNSDEWPWQGDIAELRL
jgi:putative transposase